MSAVFETFDRYANHDHGKVHELASATWNWLGNVFGCPHKEMSRPFSRQGETFRVCITCGARRQFDARKWSMQGSFYYKPARVAELRRY